MRISSRIRGTVLPVVCLCTVAAGALSVSLAQHGVRGARTAAWTREHLAARLLAESACDELLHTAQQAALDPDHAEHATILRAARVRTPARPLTTPISAADVAALSTPSAPATLATALSLRPDPSNPTDGSLAAGRLVLQATVRVGRAVVESVYREHPYHLARAALPQALDELMVLHRPTDPAILSHIPRGTTVFAAPPPGERRDLRELFFGPEGRNVEHASSADAHRAATLLESLSPVALERRAHYLPRTPEDLTRALDSLQRASLPVRGVWHCPSTSPLRLSLRDFRGRALISTAGPLILDDVRVADRTRDAVVLAAGRGIIIQGRTIEASLVCLDPTAGIDFAARATITGTFISARFPYRRGLTPEDHAACTFEAPRVPTSDPDLLLIAPTPAAIYHRAGASL